MARAQSEGAPPSGLTGVLPAASPAELEATLAQFPENWKPWADAVQADLNSLYTDQTLDAAAQRKLLAKLRRSEATARQYLGDSRYRGLSNLLMPLKGGLKRRLDLAEAVLDTVETSPALREQRRSTTARELNNAAANASNDLNLVSTGQGWRTYLQPSETMAAYASQDPAKLLNQAATVKDRFAQAPTDDATRTFLQRPAIAAYRRAADNHLGASASPEGLRQAAGELLNALEQFEDGHSSTFAREARDAYAKVVSLAPDGGARITQALRQNYFNYNVRFHAPESFINRFIAESRQDSSRINEFVSEAQVSGSQTTLSNVGVDVQPSANGALMNLVLNGTVNSATLASTDQAQVSIFGNANFNASKAIVFDGERFAVGQTLVGANARNLLGNIDTKYDGIPIIRRIAQNMAYDEASSRLGEGEQMVVNRIRSEVASKLDAEIGREFGPFGELPRKLNERIAALRKYRLFPTPLNWSSTSNEIRMVGRIMEGAELGGSEPDPSLINPRGITVLLHQSALNNGIDRLGFAGQTLTDDEMRTKLQKHLEDLLGQKVNLGGATKNVSAESAARLLSFDSQDPILIEAIDNQLELTIRAGLKQEGKEEIPPHLIRIPLKITALNEGIQISPGKVAVETVDKTESQAVRAGVIKKKIEEAFTEQLVKRSTTIQRGNRLFTMAVSMVATNEGWVYVWVE
ncbi:MAG: hypothetical protein ACK6D3_11480 [Planctomycetaceae bacterium]